MEAPRIYLTYEELKPVRLPVQVYAVAWIYLTYEELKPAGDWDDSNSCARIYLTYEELKPPFIHALLDKKSPGIYLTYEELKLGALNKIQIEIPEDLSYL